MALADAFAHRDPLSFLSTLILLEKLPREEFYQILQQSCELFVQAMLSHSNLNTPSEESRQLAANRTMKDINQAVQTLRQAMTYCQANVGIGHICGFLAASLR